MKGADPMRRRLTVAHCEPVKDAAQEETTNDGTAEIIGDASTKQIRAVSIVSLTDPKRIKEDHGKSKEDKDTRIRSTFPSDAEALSWVGQTVGFSCKKGHKPECPNQDSFSLLVVEGQYALYCVYDGHGHVGHLVSDRVREQIVKLFLGHPDHEREPEEVFKHVFLETQREIEEMVDRGQAPKGDGDREVYIDSRFSGTTCTMAFHDIRRDTLTVAHVGDSRGVLGWLVKDAKSPAGDKGPMHSEDITEDHKPNLPKEKRRIETSSPPGRVIFDGFYNHRVFSQKGSYPGLNMSRAIGDVIGHREAGLSAEPDVKTINVADIRKNGEALAMLLCTDGVWEFISSREAMDDVYRGRRESRCPAEIMEALVDRGYDAWMKDSDGEVSDDITGILVLI